MVRLFIAVVGVLLLSLIVTCNVEHKEKADFIFVNRGDVFTLDPGRMSWLTDMQAAYCLYEGLVRWNPEDFSIEPAAAEKITLSEDQTTYLFELRADARWSNGAPVTAYDFKYAWMRLLTPDTASDYSGFLFSVKGASDFWKWRTDALKEQEFITLREIQSKFDEVVYIRALDEYRLEVALEQPVPYFLDQIALAVCSPVYRPAVEGWNLDEGNWKQVINMGWHTIPIPEPSTMKWLSIDDDTGRLKYKYYWARPNTLVCNGPFQLEEWRYKRDMRFTRNPYYHSPGNSSLDSIQAITMEDPNTAVFAFEAGEVDWLNGVNVDYQSDMLLEKADGKRENIHAFPTFGTDFFSFNCRETLNNGELNPFNDPAVRRAFVYATNRDAIVKHATRLNEPVVTSFVPPHSIKDYAPVEGINYNPQRAKEDLASAGWIDRDGDGIVENENGVPFPPIDLLYTTNTNRYKWISLLLRDQWRNTLGVQTQLRGTDNKLFSRDLRSGNFMVARGRWYGDYGDPSTFLDIFHSENGNNDRGFSNPEIDSKLTQASAELDPVKRYELLREIETELFNEEVPMLVVCQLLQLYMYEPDRVSGLTSHPRLVQQLWRVNSSSDQPGDMSRQQLN